MRQAFLIALALSLLAVAGLTLLRPPRRNDSVAATPLRPRYEPMPWVEPGSREDRPIEEAPLTASEERLASFERHEDRGRDIHISNPIRGGTSMYAVSGAGRRGVRAEGGTRREKDLSVALTDGLGWLARHQEADGRWSSAAFDAHCTGASCPGSGYSGLDVGVTGLAVLAFLSCGHTRFSHAEMPGAPGQHHLRAGDVVDHGIRWLLKQQKPDGCVGPRGGPGMLVNHAAAAWALGLAADLAGDDALRHSAVDAADFLLASQEPYSGWTDSCDHQADLVTTAWAFRALAACEGAGAAFPRRSRDGIAILLGSLRANRPFGALDLSYLPGSGKSVVRGMNEDWNDHPVGAAIALLALPRCDRQSKEIDRLFATALVSDLPQFDGKGIDYHAWNFAAAALALRSPEFPEHAQAYREAARRALLPTQKTRQDGCACGSWDVDVDRWGFAGGRVYATAINLMTLADTGPR